MHVVLVRRMACACTWALAAHAWANAAFNGLEEAARYLEGMRSIARLDPAAGCIKALLVHVKLNLTCCNLCSTMAKAAYKVHLAALSFTRIEFRIKT